MLVDEGTDLAGDVGMDLPIDAPTDIGSDTGAMDAPMDIGSDMLTDATPTDLGVDMAPVGCPPVSARTPTTVDADITSDTTWDCEHLYTLDGVILGIESDALATAGTLSVGSRLLFGCATTIAGASAPYASWMNNLVGMDPMLADPTPPNDGFFDTTATYRGAFAPGTSPATSWMAGWTAFPQN